jgi:hypothetical protein
MKILVCTIVRDRFSKLNQWLNQLNEVIDLNREHNYDLSIYENDSIDGTKQWLKQKYEDKCFSRFNKLWLVTENIGTRKFGSIANEERVKLLANARNKCLNNVEISDYDYVMWVESDVKYNPQEIKILLDECEKWDILSGASYYGERIYDTWATRLTDEEEWWSVAGKEDTLTSENNIIYVKSTFNCFCLYKASGFIKSKFSGYSERLKKFDCDTAVICEQFRSNGYNKIGMNISVKIFV